MSYRRHRAGLVPSTPVTGSPQEWLAGLVKPAAPNPPPPPTTTTIWLGDYSTGDWSQWPGGVQDTAHSGTSSVGSHTVASIVTSPTPPAGLKYATKFETFFDTTGQTATPAKARAEILSDTANTHATQGQSYWYEMYSLHPTVDNLGPGTSPYYSSALKWNCITQFVSNLQFNSPKIGIEVVAGTPQFYFMTYTGTASSPHNDIVVYLGPITYDHWYHWQLFVTWSTSKATGQVQLFQDGVEVVPLQAAQTKPSDGVNQQWKQGFYRPQSNGGNNNTVIHSGARIYTSP